MLSPLDAMAGNFFRSSKNLETIKDTAVVTWGPSLERWLLKVLLGLIGANQVNDQDGKVDISQIPVEWVEILFGYKEFPENLGVYSANFVNDKVEAGLSFQTLLLEGKINGIRAKVGSIELYLSMIPKELAFRQDHPNYDQILYHPKLYHFADRNGYVSFHWD